MRLKLVPEDTNFPFLKFRHIALVFSIAMMAASVGLFMVRGLNTGIDFEGGILIEVRTPAPADIGNFRAILGGMGLGDVTVQEFGQPIDVLIRIESQKGDPDADISDSRAQELAIAEIKATLGGTIGELEYRRVEFVGPVVSDELITSSIFSILGAVGMVLLYIWFRFEWHFGVGAVIALVHDVILTIGFFAFTQIEFNLSIIAAILTIVGYSLNDTVVVYDRIREKLRKFQKMDLRELLDMSLNKTLSRTLMTSVTTLIALLSLYFLGGEVIRPFTEAMIWGVFVGTYSSVFIATPALLYFNLRRANFEMSKAESARP